MRLVLRHLPMLILCMVWAAGLAVCWPPQLVHAHQLCRTHQHSQRSVAVLAPARWHWALLLMLHLLPLAVDPAPGNGQALLALVVPLALLLSQVAVPAVLVLAVLVPAAVT